MSAYGGLLNFLNKLGKRDKMLGFHNELNKFNNTKSTNVRFHLSYDIKIILIHIFFGNVKASFYNVS